MAVTGLIFIAIATPIIFGWLIYQAYNSRPESAKNAQKTDQPVPEQKG